MFMEDILFLMMFAFITSVEPPEDLGWLSRDRIDNQFLYHPLVTRAYGRALYAADLEDTIKPYSPVNWGLWNARECYHRIQGTPAASTLVIFDGYPTDYVNDQLALGREVAADLKDYIDNSQAYSSSHKIRLAWMEQELLRRIAIYDALRTARCSSDYSCKRSAIADMHKLMGNDYFKGYLPPMLPMEYSVEIDAP